MLKTQNPLLFIQKGGVVTIYLLPNSLSREVCVLPDLSCHLTDSETEFLGCRTTHEVPPVKNPVDTEVRQQREGKRHGKRTVVRIGRLANAQRVRELQCGIA